MQNEKIQTSLPSTMYPSSGIVPMANPFLLLPNLLLMPLYMFAQLISGMFGTIQFTPANIYYATPAALPLTSESGIQSSRSSPSQPQQVQSTTIYPKITYTNTEEWELKRDKSGRLQAIIIHRKVTEGREVVDV